MRTLGYSQMRINNSIDKLKAKMKLLKSELDMEIDKIEKFQENGMDYKPNDCGIVQGLGFEIDNLCGRIGALYEMREQLEGEEE